MNEFTMAIMLPLSMTAWKVIEGFDGLVNIHDKIIRGFVIPMNWNSPVHPEFLTTDGRRRSVNRIFCIAKNYEDHAKEMGGEVDRKAPFHFQKSFDALTLGPDVRYPSHFERRRLGSGSEDATPLPPRREMPAPNIADGAPAPTPEGELVSVPRHLAHSPPSDGLWSSALREHSICKEST